MLTSSFGMDRPLHADLAAEQLAGAVGDHLVGVHVGLRAGPGLPDDRAGTRSSSAPAITSSAARTIAAAFHSGSRPAAAFTRAAAFLT